VKSEYFKIGFDRRILSKLTERSTYNVTFVGGISQVHGERIEFLERVAERGTIDLWGYGAECLSEASPLKTAYHGESWGIDMYNILHNSDITLNNHIGVAGKYANNMRLFEATGVGSFLLTDNKRNLADMFEPGKEVTAYSSTDECVEMIEYYLDHDEERRTIARAGQERTLREHTYYQRMQELVDIVRNHI